MSAEAFNRLAFPPAEIAFVALLLVRPALRLRRRTGRWPLELRRARTSAELAAGWAFALLTVAFVVWGFAYSLLGPGPLGVWTASALSGACGWSATAAGIALVVLAQVQMGDSWRVGLQRETTALVTRGLFGVVRNPIYAGLLLALLGVATVSPAPATVLAWPALAAAIAVQARLEERDQLEKHGERYRAYAARVGRFLPGIGRLRHAPTS